ncbi:MAG: hypothetical protein HY318_01670 [Armatimonadetes bacterium]|nr:hypothetical protein [Armatimonadota bacterium]
MTLHEVMAATILEQHLVEQISDTAVVVDHRTLAALLQNLKRKGYTPKVSGLDGG